MVNKPLIYIRLAISVGEVRGPGGWLTSHEVSNVSLRTRSPPMTVSTTTVKFHAAIILRLFCNLQPQRSVKFGYSIFFGFQTYRGLKVFLATEERKQRLKFLEGSSQ